MRFMLIYLWPAKIHPAYEYDFVPIIMAVETTWTEVSCQRAVAGDEYAKGVQDFLFSVSAPSVWYPSKSYFRYELQLFGPGAPGSNVAPVISNQIAFAENAVANSILNA